MKMKNTIALLQVLFLLLPATMAAAKKETKTKTQEISPLDQYIVEAINRRGPSIQNGGSPGSLWNSSALLTDLARDLRASRVDDLVTIQVTEKANASSSGDTKTSRQSGLKTGINSLLGPTAVKGALSQLANVSTNSNLQGQGATSRETVLTTTLSARVTHVLPNGYLVVEGAKDTMINSERQIVTVRGVVRPSDLGPANSISSDKLAQLELRMNGKGVVGDAIRRPNFLYRFLLGILPF
jgi:flagellar L-ring protein FlgH